MMYPFVILPDNTEIIHSEMKPGGKVKVYIEKPDAKDCFHHATCDLPGYDWQDVFGFTETEIAEYQKLLDANAQLIMQNARAKAIL